MAAQGRLSKYRVNDRVLSDIALSYYQAEACAPFIAPTVNVPLRSGKIVQFPKTIFAIRDTRRSPYSYIERSRVIEYDAKTFYLEQHAHAAVVSFEDYEEAEEGDFGIDLKSIAVSQVMETISNSVEVETIDMVVDPANYEAGLSISAVGTQKFTDSGSDPEAFIRSLKELVRSQIGVYPNSMVISTDVYNTLTLHPTFRERVKHTTTDNVDLDLLAVWFGLPRGIKVAQRLKLDEVPGSPTEGELIDIFPNETLILFFSPQSKSGSLGASNGSENAPQFKPAYGINKETASFAYTYTLAGTPSVGQERVDLDYRVFINDVVVEAKPILVSIGDNGLSSAGVLVDSLLT